MSRVIAQAVVCLLEIHHSDDNRHSDGYRNQPGSYQLPKLKMEGNIVT